MLKLNKQIILVLILAVALVLTYLYFSARPADYDGKSTMPTANKIGASPFYSPSPINTPIPSNKSVPNCLNITQDAATQKVKNIPEVQDFLNRMQTIGEPVLLTPDHSSTSSNGNLIWIIHVAEIVAETPHLTHTATFNWYYVNSCTGNTTDFQWCLHVMWKDYPDCAS